jgi:hypothetical protein
MVRVIDVVKKQVDQVETFEHKDLLVVRTKIDDTIKGHILHQTTQTTQTTHTTRPRLRFI